MVNMVAMIVATIVSLIFFLKEDKEVTDIMAGLNCIFLAIINFVILVR